MSKQQLGAAARLLPGSCCAAQLRQIESPGISLTSSGATVHQQQQQKKKKMKKERLAHAGRSGHVFDTSAGGVGGDCWLG
ncbi:hypothetical protein AWZ03_007221 [Drosophila navojoa]|uniref:Uncharacterized protein n=1 Tax=Drosophila navojoa TaxID=7232 RepID=A0A484BDF9_DRONA|nr:hypothetical protein AWZ03_007221 [Drosophila navojoa]